MKITFILIFFSLPLHALHNPGGAGEEKPIPSYLQGQYSRLMGTLDATEEISDELKAKAQDLIQRMLPYNSHAEILTLQQRLAKLGALQAAVGAEEEEDEKKVYEQKIKADFATQATESSIDHSLDKQLLSAIEKENADEVERLLLLPKKPDVNALYDNGVPAIIYASRWNLPRIVTLLIKAGAHIDAPDKQGETALLHAARHNNEDIVQALVLAGARTDVHDARGWTALRYADSYRNRHVMDILRQNAIEKDIQENPLDTTVAALMVNNPPANMVSQREKLKEELLRAVEYNRLKEVQRLLSLAQPPDINEPYYRYGGQTILSIAARMGLLKIVKWLLYEGHADVDAEDIYDHTAEFYIKNRQALNNRFFSTSTWAALEKIFDDYRKNQQCVSPYSQDLQKITEETMELVSPNSAGGNNTIGSLILDYIQPDAADIEHARRENASPEMKQALTLHDNLDQAKILREHLSQKLWHMVNINSISSVRELLAQGADYTYRLQGRSVWDMAFNNPSRDNVDRSKVQALLQNAKDKRKKRTVNKNITDQWCTIS